jgi:hypothetical protein
VSKGLLQHIRQAHAGGTCEHLTDEIALAQRLGPLCLVRFLFLTALENCGP